MQLRVWGAASNPGGRDTTTNKIFKFLTKKTLKLATLRIILST